MRALCLGLTLGAAWASPATDLYQAATGRALREYYGWSTADLPALSEKYRGILEERCAPAGDACDFATARGVLGDLLREFGDAHMAVRDPEAALRLQEVSQDLAVPRTGARVVRVEGGLLVVSLMPGSPAEQGGLKVNDLLTTVNGEAAGKRGAVNAAVGPNEFIRLERAGAPLQVTLRRAGQAEQSLSLSTRILQARDVPTLGWAGPDGRVAVISYPTFLPSDASELFLARLQEAKAAGARALVVDLRFNGGGSLAECVAAASVFAPVQYRMQFRQGSQTYRGLNGAEPRPLDLLVNGDRPGVWTGPAAILVGPNTASCSEVFTFFARQAGVLAVGEATRGVGNSGVTFGPLPDGGVMAVTILRAFTADGQPLPERITPDVLAPLDIGLLTTQGRDTTLEAALQALQAGAADQTPAVGAP
ncbi:peptidase S41 [Deinococcus koreensis]|uniref:Peptidase S41 n=1 Tax=Deinococcus koreensis TaxID=2054903 RepID=A0A2K3UU28_9DEIO|nr:peptidase S41 [Deinococcus koreensis]